MADQVVVTGKRMVPHHGPVSPDCPVECLLTVLSRMSFNRLARAERVPFPPPCTVGDVMDLYARGQLGKIGGLGRRRFSEIEAALVLAGLNLGRCRQPSAGAEGATR
jgi:hypothetical protein